MPWIHIIRQWHWVQESATGSSSPPTQHLSHLLCIIPSTINGKLDVFHKYLKPTLKKLCEKAPANWDKYLNQVLASYRVTPKSCHSRNTNFSFLWQRSKSTTTSTSTTNAMLLRQSRIRTTQSRSPSTHPCYCKENIRWEPLQDCPANHGQRTTLFQNRSI